MSDLWNLTSAEWAAWVQGIGTVLAVVAAIAIAAHQHSKSIALEQRLRTEEASRIRKLCEAAGNELFICISDYVNACEMRNADLQARVLYQLRDVIEFIRAIDIQKIPSDAIWSLMTIRSIAAEALHGAEQIIASALPQSFAVTAQNFQKLQSRANSAKLKLAAAFGNEAAAIALEERSDVAA